MKRHLLAVFAGAALVGLSPVRADERASLEELRQTTVTLIQLLVEQGTLSREKADELMRRAGVASGTTGRAAGGGAAGARTGPDGKPVVRVPFVPESVKAEIREQVKQEVISQARAERWGEPSALPDWIDRIRLEGDLRVRGQGDLFGAGNAPATFFQAQTQGPASGVDLTNTTEDRWRATIRARLGLIARLSESWGAGFRITTGALTGPASTTQTLGAGNSYFNKYAIVLDRAYLRWTSDYAMVSAGRIPNPWFSTDLIYSEDLNFDGAAATFTNRKPTPKTLNPFLTVGAFVVKENELADDRLMYGVQGGVEWNIDSDLRLRAGVAQYDFTDMEGIRAQAGSRGAPTYGITEYPRGVRQKGNTLFNVGDPLSTDVIWGLASQFRPLAFTGTLDLARFDPVHVILSGEYVLNTGYDAEDIRRRTGFTLDRRNRGYQGRLTVGYPSIRDAHEWQAFVGYRYLEPDAVIDAFTDTTWGLGGTNHKGFTLGGAYGIDRNVWLAMRWTSTNQVVGPPLAIDVFQVDLNARF